MFGSISTCSSRAFQRYHPRVCQLPSWHPNFGSGVQNHVRPPLLTATLCPDRGTAEPCGGDGARPQGWYETNDTDDDPLNDTPHPRVRVENSFAGFSKEVRICLVAGIGDAPPPPPEILTIWHLRWTFPGSPRLLRDFVRYLSLHRKSLKERRHFYSSATRGCYCLIWLGTHKARHDNSN